MLALGKMCQNLIAPVAFQLVLHIVGAVIFNVDVGRKFNTSDFVGEYFVNCVKETRKKVVIRCPTVVL